MSAPLRLGVLASGSGTNLQSILDACSSKAVDAEVAAVVCNVPEAGALARAARAGVPAVLLPHREFRTREQYDERLVQELRKRGVQLVCLAGFMRLLTPLFLQAFPDRILNIHPALLPAFPGLHAVRQALAAGVRITGCTVHFVDEGTDTGPILVQAAVPVLDGDDEDSLAARIRIQEHRCYPRAIALVAGGKVELSGRRVRVRTAQGEPARTIASPPLSDEP